MAKREFAILTRCIPGHLCDTVSEVRVMARAEGYAMVRHKGAVPFAVPEEKLSPIPPRAKGEQE